MKKLIVMVLMLMITAVYAEDTDVEITDADAAEVKEVPDVDTKEVPDVDAKDVSEVELNIIQGFVDGFTIKCEINSEPAECRCITAEMRKEDGLILRIVTKGLSLEDKIILRDIRDKCWLRDADAK